MAFPKRNQDWVPIRERFINAPERPTWGELETEFGTSSDKIRVAASDEGWAMLRAKRTAALVERSGAHQMLLAAAENQKVITDRFCSISVGTVEALEKVLTEIDGDVLEEGATKPRKLAASTRAGILNNVSFALLNLANALKSSGVVGLPRALMNEIEAKTPKGEAGKDFLKTALQQINLTVNLAREGKALDSVEVQTRVPYPRRGVHHPDSVPPRDADVL